MTIGEKIKTINNKTKQNKAQFNLDGQTANYEFYTDKEVLPEKGLLEKAARINNLNFCH